MQTILAVFRCAKHARHSSQGIIIKHFSRCLSSKITGGNNQQANISSEKKYWTPIYRFPYISIIGFLNRLKLYQTAFVLGSVPLSIYMHHFNMVETSTTKAVIGCVAFTCATLYVFTSIFRRVIGIIYISEDKCLVKIAHLTFWGKRNDIEVQSKNIIPLTDGQCDPNDAYVKVEQYNSDDVLYLTLRYGKILDKDSFIQVFGNHENLTFKK